MADNESPPEEGTEEPPPEQPAETGSDQPSADAAGDRASPEGGAKDDGTKDADKDKDGDKKEQPQESAASAQDWATDPDNARKWRSFGTEMNAALSALVGEQKLNVFFGEVTIGSLGDTYQSGQTSHITTIQRSGEVPRHVLDNIALTFVEPSNYHTLKQQLDENQILLIQSRAGCGRTTTALRILDQLCQGGVRKLDPDAKLKALTEKDLQANNGYLLEWLDPDQARGLREFHAERLAQLMSDIGCRLVVLVDETTQLVLSEVKHLRQDDLGAVQPELVVHKHAKLRLRGSTDERGRIAALDRPDVREMLTNLSSGLPNRDLVQLAGDLAALVSGQIEFLDVQERYLKTSEGAFKSWFDSLAAAEHRAFVISLAVFNNEPAQIVSDAAALLFEEFQRVEVPRRRDRGRQVFGTPLRDKVTAARAQLVHDTDESDYGTVSVRRARFSDQRFPRQVLEHVCAEYDEAFDIVRSWLSRLGDNPRQRIRIRAGMAAGLLSLTDFTGVYESVILPWSWSGSYESRQAAIAALQIPSREPAYAGAVYGMLDRWIRYKVKEFDSEGYREARRQLRITAIRALGSTEAMSPAAALRLLRYASRRKDTDWEVARSIGETMSELYCRLDNPKQVLDELLKWTDDTQHPLRREIGLLSVLTISFFLVVNVSESVERWPVLLAVAEYVPEHREKVVLLLSRMLVAANFIRRGFGEIRRWVKLAQKDPTLRDPLGRLLADVGKRSGEQDTIRFYLEYWAAERTGPVDAVNHLLANFDREESLT